MAITINGTGSITGLTAGGLPDNCVTAADLATTLDLSSNTVTLPSGTGGKILNVYQAVMKGAQSFADGVNAPGARSDITNLSITLTPASSSSKFLLTASICMGSSGQSPAYHLMCNSTGSFTDIFESTITGGSANVATWGCHQSGSVGYTYSTDLQTISFLHSPAVTSEITYKIQAQNMFGGTGNVYLNQSNADGTGGDTSYYMVRSVSSFTVMEVAS